MPLSDISAVIIVRDAEATLRNTLNSLVDFAEVLVYDNGSSDRSIDIARSFDNVKLHSGKFLGFGKTKSHAVSLAANNWVFSIDADETVSDELRGSMDALALDNPQLAYSIDRHNFMLGRQVKHGGWGNDCLLRLFHRQHHGFNDAPVHEKVCLGAAGIECRLQGALHHDAVRDIGQFLIKINRYSEIVRHSGRKPVPLAMVVLKTLFAFFRSYVLQLGLLDGWRGLVIAVSNANGTFYRYMKLLADQKTARERAL